MIKTLITTALLSLGGVNVENITPYFNNVEITKTTNENTSTNDQEPTQFNQNFNSYRQPDQSYITQTWENIARGRTGQTDIKYRTDKWVHGIYYNYVNARATIYTKNAIRKETRYQVEENEVNYFYYRDYSYILTVYCIDRMMYATEDEQIYIFSGYQPFVDEEEIIQTEYELRAYYITEEEYNKYNNLTDIRNLPQKATDIWQNYDSTNLIEQEFIEPEIEETWPNYNYMGNYLVNLGTQLTNKTYIAEIIKYDTYSQHITGNETTINTILNTTYENFNNIKRSTFFQIEGYVYPIDYDVIDIPDVMYTVLAMPFAFISKAFMPLTLWAGTPYEVNIGNIIIVVLALFVVIWVIKKIIKI